MRVWPSRRQWQGWSLPSKLTALGTLLGAISLGLYAVDKAQVIRQWLPHPAPIAATLPQVALEFVNKTDEPVTILSRGDFVLWLPQGVEDGVPRIPGKYELYIGDGEERHPDRVTIPAASTLQAYAHLLNEEKFVPVLDAGSADLEFILRRVGGGIFFSGNIPFTRDRLTTARWVVQLNADS